MVFVDGSGCNIEPGFLDSGFQDLWRELAGVSDGDSLCDYGHVDSYGRRQEGIKDALDRKDATSVHLSQ